MAHRARHFHLVLSIAAVLTVTPAVDAQVIRGNVSLQTGATVAGAVITLSRAADNDTVAGTDVRTVLSTARGAYTVAAPSQGRYRIIVRRIGSRPYRSDVLEIAGAQTLQHDVVLEPLLPGNSSMALPEIRVTRATPCQRDAADAMRIATLWNDARTALLSAEASLGSGSTQSFLIRYSRQLDPRPPDPDRPGRSVLSEVLQVFDNADVGNPRGFESISGDSLSAVGYWRRVNGMVTYHGPDARALLSEAFVRDHCFRIIESSNAERDSVGLVFQPIPTRATLSAPPEIRGAAWFDAASSRLTRVEFNWTKMPRNEPTAGLGGNLSFRWSLDGAVRVDRWELRMPQVVVERRELGYATNTLTHIGIVEEGGVVFADSTATSTGYGAVQGDLKVDGRRALAGAHVRVLGTTLSTQTDQAGKFLFDSIPAGLRIIVADHPGYSGYGLRAATMRILLDAGEFRQVSLQAPGQEEIATTLCGPGAMAEGRSLLRLTVMDSASAQPLGGAHVRLVGGGRNTQSSVDRETDARGAALFCGLPPGQPFVLTTATGVVLLSEFSLGRNTLAVRQVWVQRP
jgi:hypothetical protein